MTMFPTLNVPGKLPEWALNGTYVDEPAQGNKNDGFLPGYKPPARWWNWVLNLNYQWAKKAMSTVLMNWWEETALSASHAGSVFFHPVVGVWTVAHYNNTTVFTSPDGHIWTAGIALSSNALTGFAAIDLLNYIFANDNDDIEYSANGGQSGVWTTVLDATIGGTGALAVIGTKYPASNFAIVSRGDSQIRIAATGVTGSFVVASTPPPTPPGPAVAIIYVGGTTWLLAASAFGSYESEVYKSTDDGDTWAATSPGAGPQFPAGGTGLHHMAHNEDLGRLVAVGDDIIVYSDNLGDNWVTATVDTKWSPTFDLVYYCGGGSWIATNIGIGATYEPALYMSSDNAETWVPVDMHGAVVGVAIQIVTMGCDGQKPMVFGTSGFNAHSLAT